MDDISERPVRVINDNRTFPNAHRVALYLEAKDSEVIDALKHMNPHTRMARVHGVHIEFADSIDFSKRKKVRIVETGDTYPSVRDMAIILGRREQPIRDALLGRTESYYGDHLEFA